MSKQTNITILLDPEIKRAYQQVCKLEDTTISQDLRKFINDRLKKTAQQKLKLDGK